MDRTALDAHVDVDEGVDAVEVLRHSRHAQQRFASRCDARRRSFDGNVRGFELRHTKEVLAEAAREDSPDQTQTHHGKRPDEHEAEEDGLRGRPVHCEAVDRRDDGHADERAGERAHTSDDDRDEQPET